MRKWRLVRAKVKKKRPLWEEAQALKRQVVENDVVVKMREDELRRAERDVAKAKAKESSRRGTGMPGFVQLKQKPITLDSTSLQG